MTELVQLTRAQLVKLQLGDCDQLGGGYHCQLVQLRLAQLVQLQLVLQAHVMGFDTLVCDNF